MVTWKNVGLTVLRASLQDNKHFPREKLSSLEQDLNLQSLFLYLTEPPRQLSRLGTNPIFPLTMHLHVHVHM